MEKKEKRVIVPMVDIRHNDNDKGFTIRVDLAGAPKESVELEMGNGGFCVKGEGHDFRYENCYMLAHEVKARDAKAKFDSGLLTIDVPFKESWRGHKVAIEF
jgi:HSP20 family molecular chaperone IbpA